MRVLVTGTAGFIGFHTARKFLARGDQVLGVDIVNAYYDTALKESRLAILKQTPGFTEARIDIADTGAMQEAFKNFAPERVVHLAAQAGVRHSVDHPHDYAHSNLTGFLNVLEGCRHNAVGHLTYASTSSVYGGNRSTPFRETDGVGHPVSFYAATKRANEVMAHSYAHLYGMPVTGLRFFTVYGPWGRPDMALFKFVRAMLANEPIDVYNHGDMRRDFTYVDDVVEGVVRVSDTPAAPDPDWDASVPEPLPDRSGIAPFRVYNIGNGQPVALMDFIKAIEAELGRPAKLNMMPMQPGDVAETYASTQRLHDLVQYRPATPVRQGIAAFIRWYLDYYNTQA